MSGTFPSTPKPSGFTLRSISPTFVSVAYSLKRQVRSRGGQRFSASITWPPMLRARFAPILAFALAQRGQYGSFQIVLPSPYGTPQGSWAGGAPKVDGAAQVGRSVNLKNFTPGASGVVKAGDLLVFAGHTKGYIATADANADGAGKVAGLAIEPALVESPAAAEVVTYTSIPLTMAFSGDILEHQLTPGGIFAFSAELMEAY